MEYLLEKIQKWTIKEPDDVIGWGLALMRLAYVDVGLGILGRLPSAVISLQPPGRELAEQGASIYPAIISWAIPTTWIGFAVVFAIWFAGWRVAIYAQKMKHTVNHI
jgi:hypothetical protein